MVLTQIWSVKKNDHILENSFFYLSNHVFHESFFNFNQSFFVAKVRSLLCIQGCFCINRSYHFFTFSSNSKISVCIYTIPYWMASGKVIYLIVTYCVSVFVVHFSLFLCIKMWNIVFCFFFGGSTCALSQKGHWFIFVSILNLFILILFCHLLC